jgi:hypothetical protein
VGRRAEAVEVEVGEAVDAGGVIKVLPLLEISLGTGETKEEGVFEGALRSIGQRG